MTDHRGFWGAFGLALLTIGLGGYVSYTVGRAFTTRPIHLGFIPVICLFLIIGGGLILLGLIAVFMHLWYVKRYLTRAAVRCESLYLRATILRKVGTNPDESADLDKRCKEWREETAKWLGKHDFAAYARFINDSGLVAAQGLLTDSIPDRLLAELDTRLARLLDIASSL